MNQKGFTNIALVVVIIAIVAVGGYFVFVKKSEAITQQPTPTPTQTKTLVFSNIIHLPDSGVVDLLVISVSQSDRCYKKAISTPVGESGIPGRLPHSESPIAGHREWKVPARANAVPAIPTKSGDAHQNEPCPPENRIPSDSVTVRVEKIVSYNRDPNYHSETLQEGNTYRSYFISRPAKFKYITVVPKPTGPGPEQIQQYLPESGFQGIENGFYIYGLYSFGSVGSLTKEREVVMPGLKEGDKIRAQFNFDGNLSITEYELLK